MIRALSLGFVVSAAALSQAQSSIVHFQSGNGDGAQDSKIYTQRGTTTGSFPTLAPTDFSPTLSGEKAYQFGTPANWGVLAGGWLPNGGLSAGSTARWVGVDPDGAYGVPSHSAIYAISFKPRLHRRSDLEFPVYVGRRAG
jgi:hypothetical protein